MFEGALAVRGEGSRLSVVAYSLADSKGLVKAVKTDGDHRSIFGESCLRPISALNRQREADGMLRALRTIVAADEGYGLRIADCGLFQ